MKVFVVSSDPVYDHSMNIMKSVTVQEVCSSREKAEIWAETIGVKLGRSKWDYSIEEFEMEV